MANARQGEVALSSEAGTWIIKLSARAAATLEQQFDAPLISFFGQLDAGSIRHLAAFIVATSTPPMKVDEAFAVLDEIGGKAVQSCIMEAIKVSGLMKGAAKTEEQDGAENPPEATAAA